MQATPFEEAFRFDEMTTTLVLHSVDSGFSRPQSRKPVVWVLLIVGLAIAIVSPAHATSSLQFDIERVPWERLVFRSAEHPDELRVEVTLKEVPKNQLEGSLDANSGEDPSIDAALDVLQLSSTIEVFYTGRTYRTDVLFTPAGLSPLQRRRDKIGSDPSRKSYRYQNEGVRRLRIEPSGDDEAAKEPGQWTHVRETYFPYRRAASECPVLSDPSLLLIAATMVLNQDPKTRTLCVFNKKGVHRAQLTDGADVILPISYLEMEGTRHERVNRKVDAKSISITATPPDDGSIAFEPFEFFEMGGEIELTFDRENGLPLKISGEIRGLGRVDFVLSEVSQRR